MPSLAYFTSSIPAQTAVQAYGVTADVNIFNVSSSFTSAGSENVYAVLKGTILLQQQTDVSKVNLILRPKDQKEFRLPVKYIIYRGLKTLDFLDSTNISDITNKVKTSGSELLAKMQTIQAQRAPGTAIPVEALFGNELAPAATKNIDEFFFKNLAASSQLFTIDCGMQLGTFAAGEVSIEVVLENPEFVVTADLAKKAKHDINVTSIADPLQKKWIQDSVRHFVDPAAFFGLHHNITGGIEYRPAGTTRSVANTPALVYQNIVDKFFTKNRLYLDIRNENGYSYNYYNNYKGTGTDALKNIKVGQSAAAMVSKEYYTNGWAIHIVEVTPGAAAENDVFLALRINDNEKPLLAGWNVSLTPNTVIDPPVSNTISQRVYFVDETALLPVAASEFTNTVTLKVPNVLGTAPAQLATLVRLDYIKQLRLTDGADAFPLQNSTDYLFCPINTDIPWNSQDGIKWIDSGHYKYFDGLNHGFVSGTMEEAITGLDISLKKITINKKIDAQITDRVKIANTANAQNVGTYNVIKVENPTAASTAITVLENIPSSLQAGDTLEFTVEAAAVFDYQNKKAIAKNIDLSGITAFGAGKKVKLIAKKSVETVQTVVSSSFTGGNTEITLNAIDKQGFGSIMLTGIVSEMDLATGPTPPDNDNVLFYAVPQYYFKNSGGKNNKTFNFKGATSKNESFFKTIQNFTPDFKIEKYSLQPTTGNFVATLGYNDQVKLKENIFVLGLKKSEFEDLKADAAALLSPYHIQSLKLIPQGNLLRDQDYEGYYKYHVTVAGLDIAGGYCETTVYKEVYTRDGLIFTSPEYARTGTSPSAIQLDQALDELLDINIHSLTKLQNKSPEEIAQLETIWANGTSGGTFMKGNKELYLLDGHSITSSVITLTGDLNTLPLELRNELDILYSNYPNTVIPVTEIENLISQKGAELIILARQRIRALGQPYKNKDGIVYLVRLMMQLVIKNHKTIVKSAGGYQKFYDIFEKASRGLEGSAKPSFSGYPTHKKVLISGFDPFGSGVDWEDFNSNPSGNIALAMDGVVIDNNTIVRSGIFPVRYIEFNNNWIENFFTSYINNVDMMITFSYGIDNYDFQLDRFSSDFRYGALTDNNNAKDLTKNLGIGDTFIENKLPYDLLSAGGKLEIPGSSCKIGLNHRAYWAIYADQISPAKTNQNVTALHSLSKKFQTYSSEYSYWSNLSVMAVDLHLLDSSKPAFDQANFFSNAQASDDLKFKDPSAPEYVKPPSWSNYPSTQSWVTNYKNFSIKARMGSGQFYFSNEIHYRVANLRNKLKPGLKTGHIHVGFLKGDPTLDRDEMITAVTSIIKKMKDGL